MSDIIQYLSFSVWLPSLSLIISKSMHVAADGIISFFLWLSNIPLSMCTTSSLLFFFSHLLYTILCCWTFRFPYLSYCKQGCNEDWVCVSFQIRVFSRYMPRSGTLLELMYDPVPLFNALWRTSVRRNSATVPMVSREQNYFSSTWENLFHVVDSQQPEAPVKAWDNNNSLKLSIHESENEGKRQENHHLSQGRLV